MSRLGATALAAWLVAMPGAAFSGTVPEPKSYRLDEYKAEVPATLKGATVIATDQARALWEKRDAVFLDVMPQLPKPDPLPAGTIWRDKPRNNIPGSIWLANVGYGALNPDMEAYFEKSLSAVTGGDKTRKIVFYCMSNCWMSWNAAKRAISYGYAHVIWFPAGADGWQANKLPLELASPYKLPSP